MTTYVLLTRLSPEAVTYPARHRELEQEVKKKVQQNCPDVHWVADYSILGPCDYMDIFEAPDEATASKVAAIVRSFGHATTETWTAIPWPRFREMTKEIS